MCSIFLSKKSPTQPWSQKPNWLEHFGSMSVKLENNTDINRHFSCLRGSDRIYSGVLISWFYLIIWASVSIWWTKYNRHEQIKESHHSALCTKLLDTCWLCLLLTQGFQCPPQSEECQATILPSLSSSFQKQRWKDITDQNPAHTYYCNLSLSTRDHQPQKF